VVAVPLLSPFITALLVTTAAGLATTVGGAMVLFTRRPSPRLLAFGLAFAAGAMVYVSLAEILPKATIAFTAMDGARHGLAWATAAFLAGLLLIVAIDQLIPNPHDSLDKQAPSYAGDNPAQLRKIGLLTGVAITAHNLPEGLATFFATLDSPALGLPLALAIAVHNIPEGIAIAIPVFAATRSRRAALLASLVSGLAEPVGALTGYALLGGHVTDALYGWVFGVIAGIMVYLSLDELLPAAKRHATGHETVYGLVGGMALMSISLVLFKW
jgi:ZIP family zinc transporter